MTTQTEDTNMADETMGRKAKRPVPKNIQIDINGLRAAYIIFDRPLDGIDAELIYNQLLNADAKADELDRLRTELATLREQLETERIRLAACGVVAMSNTPESAAKAREMLPIYWSASCGDVEKAVDREMALRTELASARVNEARYLWVRTEHAKIDGSARHHVTGMNCIHGAMLDDEIDSAISQVQP